MTKQTVVDSEERNKQFYSKLWTDNIEVYESHPTSRHRRRFVLNSISTETLTPDSFVFDYGCGSGAVLNAIRSRFALTDEQLGGCDIAPEALSLVRQRFSSPYFVLGSYPEFSHSIDVAICTEVIEHTPDYRQILEWLYTHLRPDGLLVLTTPSIPMDPPDVAYGHVQHFEIESLCSILESIGYHIEYAHRWGFPFFTIQKALTRSAYKTIDKYVIRKKLTMLHTILFELVYRAYFIHDIVSRGPQIFIRARK